MFDLENFKVLLNGVINEDNNRITESIFATDSKNGYTQEDVSIAFDKIKKMIESPYLTGVIGFLCRLDYDTITEDEIEEVNKMYEFAKVQGYITEDGEMAMGDMSGGGDVGISGDIGGDVGITGDISNTDSTEQPTNPNRPAEIDDMIKKEILPRGFMPYSVGGYRAPDITLVPFKVFYSANRNGFTTTGVLISKPVKSAKEAKELVKDKLEKQGFKNIKITSVNKLLSEDVTSDGFIKNKPTLTQEDDTGIANSLKPISTLSRKEKFELFTKFLDLFRKTLIKMGKNSYVDLSLREKADFWLLLSKTWPGEYDTREFLDADSISKMETLTVH